MSTCLRAKQPSVLRLGANTRKDLEPQLARSLFGGRVFGSGLKPGDACTYVRGLLDHRTGTLTSHEDIDDLDLRIELKNDLGDLGGSPGVQSAAAGHDNGPCCLEFGHYFRSACPPNHVTAATHGGLAGSHR